MMIDYTALVAKFISVLQEKGLVDQVNMDPMVTKVVTERYIINIYYPNTLKEDFSIDQPIIHLDVDLLYSSFDKVVRRILGVHNRGEKVFARQTVVVRIDKNRAIDFQEEHHLQYALAGKYRYGLYHNGELVSVAVFSGGRNMKQEEGEYRSFELLRFCHKSDMAVVGGVSKLIKAFIKDFHPQDIMTYADRDWGQDSSLTSVGFEKIGILDPITFYIKDGLRYSNKQNDMSYDYLVQNTGSIKLKMFL